MNNFLLMCAKFKDYFLVLACKSIVGATRHRSSSEKFPSSYAPPTYQLTICSHLESAIFPYLSEPESQRVTAPAPPKRCATQHFTLVGWNVNYRKGGGGLVVNLVTSLFSASLPQSDFQTRYS
jgi:hypothetical protein